MQERIDHLSRTIRDAAQQERPLRIRGGGTKDFYGEELRGEALEITPYRGIVTYEATELVITARGGTPLAEVEAALREKGQLLAFEPPHFGAAATLGGCVSAGLSGPRRAYSGAVRDFVLGVRLLDGTGRDLRFGGQVMKNVAGYDVSRLVAGSLGTLGVLLEISLKVLPAPPVETTLLLACSGSEAVGLMNQWSAKPLPITATSWREDELSVRLSGALPAVESAIAKIGGTRIDPETADRFWTGIREQTDPWFTGTRPLWRLSVKSTTPPLPVPGETLLEWSGALRWLRSGADPREVRDAARAAGGHATLFRSADKSPGAFHPLPEGLMAVHRRLKRAFDPAGILNPGRLYADL
jgi:glycolate oxidase FAD binding subunit